jgi:hypothetical protein
METAQMSRESVWNPSKTYTRQNSSMKKLRLLSFGSSIVVRTLPFMNQNTTK